jgi:predicted CXXCH cytochrome family protein
LGICARCHSHRSVLGDYNNNNEDLLDHIIPQTLVEPFYYADGQILEEDYVFGSFAQSKMFQKEVKCNDCHDVHSGKLLKRGNDLCLQCHRPDLYNTPAHHFHKMPGDNLEHILDNTGEPYYEEGEGAQCINCHMIEKYYMGNDYRRDHSFRIPRPDLTLETGSPNACTQCHKDKNAQWAQSYIEKWYGQKKRPHYGQTFFAAQHGKANATDKQALYATNELFPVMVRATSLILLGHYNDSISQAAIRTSLQDPESLVRHSALMGYTPVGMSDYIKTLVPLLSDPVLAIRTEAAFRLSDVHPDSLSAAQKKALAYALEEYKKTNLYMSDFPGGQYNLGNVYMKTGEYGLAEDAYLESIRIDNMFYQAKVNLAMLYNSEGKNPEAERLLREVLADFPELHELNCSLGLLLTEEGRYDESKKYLQLAYKQMPYNTRILYNLALLENEMKNFDKAEKYFLGTLGKEPDNFDFLYGISTFYLEHSELKKASYYIQELIDKYPQNATGRQLLSLVRQKQKQKTTN